jgi:hypothetical protein
VRRELGLDRGPVLGDQVGEALAHRVELRAAVVDHAVAALEAERQHAVDQLQQLAVRGHVLRELGQQLEHFLAAPGLVVELHEQALLVPAGLHAPGRVGHRLVERRAQHVASGQHRLVAHARAPRAGVELVDRVGGGRAQRGHVGRLREVAQLADQHQQLAGGRDQRVQQAELAHVRGGCRVGAAEERRRSLCGGSACRAACAAWA